MEPIACKSGKPCSVKYFLGLLLLVPCAASAEIYRCESRGETYFSQIPCNDQAEEVVIEDRPMFTGAAGPSTLPPSATPPAKTPARTQADNLREFVETLNRQRSEEIAEADLAISGVEQQLAATEGRPDEDPERVALDGKLAELQASRTSTAAQYDSMISEAERRVAEMASNGRAVAKSGTKDG